MNEPDDPLRAHFDRQRADDRSRAPDFHSMSAAARRVAAQHRGAGHHSPLRWLAPAFAALLIALILMRREHAIDYAYSERIALLVTELEPLSGGDSSLPSDLLPPAFADTRSNSNSL